jgi:Ser/Thr protein kinase RdoA (MazF antagonist)
MHRPGQLERSTILAELHWLQALQQDTDLQTPRPVPATNGDALVAVTLPNRQQPFYAVLFEWLTGRHLPTSQQTPAQAYQVGQLIASLHQQASAFCLPPQLGRRRLDGAYLHAQCEWLALPEQHHLFGPQHFELFRLVVERAQAVFDELDQSPDSFGLIHADLIWKNYFFHNTGAGVLDFDSCSWGYFLYDLAPTLLGYRDEAHYPALRRELLSGYRQLRPLPAQYEPYLDTLIAARHLVSCAWLVARLEQPTLRQNAPAIITYRTGEMCQLLGIPAINI